MLALALVLALQNAPPSPGDLAAPQIHWQRSLEDAAAQSARDGRPLLVVINADGESASERIVSERYRDPAFVAHTRSFHCVIGSFFRHSPRDFDAQGRRVPCPRLGEVTCGEHMALEPVLHERYLLGEHIVVDDGVVQRISPRHALVLPDGRKEWDLYLLFDFRTLDARLAEASARWPASASMPWEPALADPRHRARLEREELAASSSDPARWLASLLARPWVDRGLVGEVRRLLPRLDTGDADIRRSLYDLGARGGCTQELAGALRSHSLGWHAHPAKTVPALVDLAWDDVGARTFALSHAVLAPPDEARAVRAALAARGVSELPEPFDLGQRSLPQREAVRAGKGKPPLPPAPELEAALEAADEVLSRDRGAADAQLELGRAALLLARRRMQDGGAGIELLLQDARLALARAQEARPDDVLLMLDRARVANYLSDFEEQERLALAALATRGVELAGPPLDDDITEAARWVGDAAARLLWQRASGDPQRAAQGMRRGALALMQAAYGPETDATDWLSLASFFGALGRQRERVELAFAGLASFPLDLALRNELSAACWALGEPELLVERSEQLARTHAERGWPELDWYRGYAQLLLAEWRRRGAANEAALESYAQASAAYERASDSPFRDSCEHHLALCELGRGFAHLAAGRREAAAEALLSAANLRPAIFGVRDGLDREAADLVDAVFEWRTGGASPVDARALLGGLSAEARADSRWASAISDSNLREALRAFGRGASEEAWGYLEVALLGARQALESAPDETARRATAQVLTITAERRLEQDRAEDRERVAAA
ncbi:MAG: hypothetical protein ACKO4Q_04440, partial [Planctomycetota bacterium]